MNVLFLGVYLDETGWAKAAIDYILALDAAGVYVVPRPIKLNGARPILPDRLKELEGRSHDRVYDAVVQNILPPYFDYCGRIPRNIGLYCTETNRIDGYGWVPHINCMDDAWTYCDDSRQVSIDSGVTIPVHTVPTPADVAKYSRSYSPLSIRDKLRDSFIFYFIGEFQKRKNISALLRAFHTEFDVNEPVNLVIKTNVPGSTGTPYQDREQVIFEINRVKEALKLYPSIEGYKQEVVLTGHYTDEEIMRLHASCDCFVCPSFGEAWNRPAFDSMALGKTPIVTGAGGFLQYLEVAPDGSCLQGWLVKSHKEPVFSMQNISLPNMFTGRETWNAVDILDLMACMRAAYEDGPVRQGKSIGGRKRAHDFSYQKMGELMKEILNDVHCGTT